MDVAAHGGFPLVDLERRRWLEVLAAACERVIAELGTDLRHVGLAKDLEELLARVCVS